MNKNNENYKKSKNFWLDESYKFSSLYKTKNLFLLPYINELRKLENI